MKILKARLHGFRNHTDTNFDFGLHMNVFLGDNGQGKTNALEALSYCCLTKSFYTSTDKTALQQGKDFFEITAELEADRGKEFAIRVAYDDTAKVKKYTVNNNKPEKLSSIIGKFPVVILSPENGSITVGPPSERRRFIDLVIAQSYTAYTDDIIQYKRTLQQRNKILSEARGKDCYELLKPWNDILINYGAKIIQRRYKVINEFSPFVKKVYLEIVDQKEEPNLQYIPTVLIKDETNEKDVQQLLKTKLEKRYKDELRFKTTLVGPHRDEIGFTINATPIKHYASQGQHKTFLAALKIAEFFYLQEQCNETPIILLDDIFSELDVKRSQKLLFLVESLGQTFITATSESIFGGTEWNSKKRKFIISNGNVLNDAKAA